jgi:hypothetical protein
VQDDAMIELDCVHKAKWGMIEHVNLLKEKGLPAPPKESEPKDHYPESARTGVRLKVSIPRGFYDCWLLEGA